jgi:signal transduction histidine kinase
MSRTLRERLLTMRRRLAEAAHGVDLGEPRDAVGVTIVLGLALTGIAEVSIDGHYESFKPSLYTAIETIAAVAGLLVAYLVFFRYRRNAHLDDLLLAAGLVVLSLSSVAFGLVPAVFESYSTRFAIWASIAGLLLSSVIICVAAYAPAKVLEHRRKSALVVVVGAVASVCALGAIGGLLELTPGTFSMSSEHHVSLSVQLAVIGLFGAASVGFINRAERSDDALMSWLAVASALGALAALNFALHPSFESGHVYIGDAFRLLFYGALVAGAAREIRHYWDESMHSAVLEERRRIARDLHDGLAQELAYIVRRAGRAMQEQPHSQLARQLMSAAERAVDESRRVIAALTRPLDEPLEVALSEAVKDVADRVGTIAALALDRDVRVGPDVREALLRIAREAVTNAARHGEAGIVRVELEHAENGNKARLRIVDDGRGFNTATSTPTRRSGGFGLVSMAERAEAVGAVFHVESRVGLGTTVEVELP